MFFKRQKAPEATPAQTWVLEAITPLLEVAGFAAAQLLEQRCPLDRAQIRTSTKAISTKSDAVKGSESQASSLGSSALRTVRSNARVAS
jgi:hypothetical protein